jgi:quercetin dioxygenase-like cupin family protein
MAGTIESILFIMPNISIRYKASSAETDGAFELIEYTVPPYCAGPVCQGHAQTMIAWYVLEGMLAFTLDGRTITALRGTCVVIPPRTPHTFFNPAAASATFLLWCVPGESEDCCAKLVSPYCD